jgi:hypothetical protein
VRSDSPDLVHAGRGGEHAGEERPRGGDSPLLPLDSAPDHHFVHKPVHFVAGAHAHMVGGSGEVLGLR